MPQQQDADDINRRRDSTSEINLPYLSYIMFCILPVQILKRTCATAALNLLGYIRSLRFIYRNTNVTVAGTGSVVEGLCLDYYAVRNMFQENDIRFHDEMSDLDVMISRPCVYSFNENTPDFILEKRTNALHPGYVRLLKKEERVYISWSDIWEDIPEFEHPEDMQHYNHGPAQTMDMAISLGEHGRFCDSVDRVFCLSYPLWPEQADEWLTRHRPSGWPSQALIDTVRRAGCHFVPVAHPNSSRPDIEWRFSFSKAEVILCQSLTWTQKQCYVLTKLLCKHVIGESDIYCSYYLKTVFFWCCEKISTDQWQPITLASCFLRLLDDLLECVKEGNIPNYFIRTNNMISHISKEKLENITSNIECLRRYPLKYLLKWNRIYATDYSLDPLTFINIFDLDNPLQRPKLLNRQYIETRCKYLMTDYILNLNPLQAIECVAYGESFFKSEHLSSTSERFITLFNHLLISGWLKSHSVLYGLNVIKYGLCGDFSEKDNISAQNNHVAEEYVTICSKLNEITEQTLPEFNLNEIGFTEEKSLLHKSILLYMMCRYQEACDCSKGILKNAMSGDSAAVNTLTPLINPVLADNGCREPSSTRFGTVSAHALYMMLMAGSKGNGLTDEVVTKRAFLFVLNSLCPSTPQYSFLPLSYSYMTTDRYLRAIYFFILGGIGDNEAAPDRLMCTLICLLLELLHVAPYVNSSEFQHLAKTVLELLMSPQKINTAEKYDIGHLLLELARIYNYQMLTHVSYSALKEKCYLAYRSSLKNHTYAHTEALSEFMVFLCKTRHPHMVYVPRIFMHFLIVRRWSGNARVLDQIPILPQFKFIEENHDTISQVGFKDILQTCIGMVEKAMKDGYCALSKYLYIHENTIDI